MNPESSIAYEKQFWNCLVLYDEQITKFFDGEQKETLHNIIIQAYQWYENNRGHKDIEFYNEKLFKIQETLENVRKASKKH